MGLLAMEYPDTGMIVGQSPTTEGYFHAFAWTAKSGMVDIGTLADIGYSGHNYSRANAVNKSGSLIVGWSGNDNYGYDILPVVWTRKVVGSIERPDDNLDYPKTRHDRVSAFLWLVGTGGE